MKLNKQLFANDFVSTDQNLSVKDVEYWKTTINKNLKIGVELESEFEQNKPLRDIADVLRSELIPTNNNSKFGAYGVHSIIGDGSLYHGLELPMIGKRLDFWSSMDNLDKVVGAMKGEGAFLHQRAGLHNHMLLSYNNSGNEMEKNMPGIIVRNFIQLFRRFASELVWITSTNKGPNGQITRMENFRSVDTMMTYTPAKADRNVNELLRCIDGQSYPFLRPSLMKAEGDEITRFHIELRFPDCSLNPSQIVAQQVLFKAMLMKAVEFSQYGIVNAAGSDELWVEQKELLAKILRNDNERLSRAISEDDKIKLQERAENMVMYFTNNIIQIEPIALEILEKLAQKPVSIRRFENDDLDKIEKDLRPKDEREKEQFEDIAKVINMMSIIGCTTKKEWEEQLAEQLGVSYKVANNRVWKFGQVRKLDFDKKLGTVMFV